MVGFNNQEILQKIKQYTPEGYCDDTSLIVESAKGSYFKDIDGKQYLDFTSGIFTNSFGHCYPPLIEAEIKQINICDNIHGRRSLAEYNFYQELNTFMPQKDYKFIPYNDGGYAVDRGVSDIINYFNKERIPIIAFRGGFHGKTMGTKLTINETEKAALFDNSQVDYPNCYRCPYKKEKNSCGYCCIKEVLNKLQERKAKVVLFEAVQGSGVIIPPKDFMTALYEYCQQNNILMFADEVLTGAGRTGHFLASFGLYGIKPDVVSITKGLANGRPLSVLCEREYITNNPYGKRRGERSSTFAAHPVNLAVATEVLRLLKKENILENVRNQGEVLKEGLLKIKQANSYVGDVRCVGLMAAIEFVKPNTDKEAACDFAQDVFFNMRKNGIEVINSGHILRLAPPLNISKDEIEQGLEIISLSIRETNEERKRRNS